jgi:hypothetical protein
MMPDGMYQRVCFIEPTAGYVTHQFLYSPAGNEIARSSAADHKYYPEYQCALPHRVDLNLAPAMGPPLAMRIEVGSYTVNQLLSGDPQLFTMPSSASQAVDLSKLTGVPAAVTSGSSVAAVPPTTSPISYSASVPAAYPLRGTVR